MRPAGPVTARTNLQLKALRQFFGLIVLILGAFLPVIPLLGDWPPFPWPLPILWAAAGWGATIGGLRPIIAIVLIGLGMDALTGAALGSTSIAGLGTYLLAFIGAPYLSRDRGGPAIFAYALISAGGLGIAVLARLMTLGGNSGIESVASAWFTSLLLFPVFGRLYFETSTEKRRWERS
jgi:hypothetical protein